MKNLYLYRSGYIGGALGGVSLFRDANGNASLASGLAWFMIYHLKFFPHNTSYISGLWEKVTLSACNSIYT